MMGAIIGVIIGVIINRLIIKPLEVKRYRKMCADEGLVPVQWYYKKEVDE